MFEKKILTKSSFFSLLLFLLLILPSGASNQTGSAVEALENLNSTKTGVFTSGELVYVSNGKDLGSESYELTKRESGEIVLTSNGVVTPPIPIPFVKPKIKFDQEITVGEDFAPKSLRLDYNGPFGIGSDRIRATVRDGRVEAVLGGDNKQVSLETTYSFFQGTGGSQALTALILVSKDGLNEITEIRTGGTGPQSGDKDRLKVNLELKREENQNLEINGNRKKVRRYVLSDPGSSVDKVILTDGGTFIAYLRVGGENPFFVYRSDLLGEDYEFDYQR
ncbi:hypothetical protein K9M78_06220 [Candidatus Bipolaricaulota bacterium]|nr:hypothetical protein [Candidatus Bipolaricaulota bacterium]